MNEENFLEEFDEKIGNAEELQTILSRINNDIEKFEQDKENFEIDKITAENRSALDDEQNENNIRDIDAELENKREQAEAINRLADIRNEIAEIEKTAEDTTIDDEEDISKYMEARENANNQIRDLMEETDNILKNLNSLINELDKMQGKKTNHKSAMWKIKERYNLIKDANLKSEMQQYDTQDDGEYYISDEGYVYKLDNETETLVYDDEKTIDYVLRGNMSEVEAEPEQEAEAEAEAEIEAKSEAEPEKLNPELRHQMDFYEAVGEFDTDNYYEFYIDDKDQIYKYHKASDTFVLDDEKTRKHKEESETKKEKEKQESKPKIPTKKMTTKKTVESKPIETSSETQPKSKKESLPILVQDIILLPADFSGLEELSKGPLLSLTKWISEHTSENGRIHIWAENSYNKMLGRKIKRVISKARKTLEKGGDVKKYKISRSQEENSQEFRNDALLESYFLQDALKKIESNPKEFEDSSNLSKTGKSKIIPIPEQHASKDSMRNLEGQHFAATLNPELPSYTHLDEDRQQSSSAPERKASHMRASAKEQTNDDEMEH